MHGKSKKAVQPDGLVKSIFLAYFILFLHVLIVCCLGVLVLVFKGLVSYMPWILLGGGALAVASGYRFYTQAKRGKNSLRDILSDPLLSGRSVEVSFCGGLATFRLGTPRTASPTVLNEAGSSRALEDPATARIRELSELARLLEQDLITREEYSLAKHRLLGS